ncbi:transposase-like protein [Paraburkholderia sp. 40]
MANLDRQKRRLKVRQATYLNNITEQDHQVIKRYTRPMFRFKSFRCARILLGGIEAAHTISKGQFKGQRHLINIRRPILSLEA